MLNYQRVSLGMALVDELLYESCARSMLLGSPWLHCQYYAAFWELQSTKGLNSIHLGLNTPMGLWFSVGIHKQHWPVSICPGVGWSNVDTILKFEKTLCKDHRCLDNNFILVLVVLPVGDQTWISHHSKSGALRVQRPNKPFKWPFSLFVRWCAQQALAQSDIAPPKMW